MYLYILLLNLIQSLKENTSIVDLKINLYIFTGEIHKKTINKLCELIQTNNNILNFSITNLSINYYIKIFESLKSNHSISDLKMTSHCNVNFITSLSYKYNELIVFVIYYTIITL